MPNLQIKTTHIVTTEDLQVYCDPPLTFEAVGNIDPQTHQELQSWHTAKYPPEQAARFVSRLFRSFSAGGETYPLATEADVQALQEAVGDAWLADLVERFWDYEFNYFKKKRAGSGASLPALNTGSESEAQP